MDLADALSKKAKEFKVSVPCRVGVVMDEILTTDKDRAVFRKYLADREASGAGIARAFKSVGIALTSESINRHRKGECKCPQ